MPGEIYSKLILDGHWDEGALPVQKKMLDDFAKKYHLQDQDWGKEKRSRVGM